MDETRIDEPGAQGDGRTADAAEAQEAKRSLAGVLAGDLNTVAVTTAAAVASAYAVKKILGQELAGKPASGDEGQAPEADAPA